MVGFRKENVMKTYDLVLVMPVYNEEECIDSVVKNWDQMLSELEIQYALFIYNDGSRDSTENVLARFDCDDSVRVVNKPNSGHGPTILCGYREAVTAAEWVFQCDSDGEMLPDGFPELWRQRNEYDALFGYRENRVQSKGRALISAVSRMAVRLFFGQGVRDVNTPYRLMRSDILSKFIDAIPKDTFAPNIIVSGEFNRRGVRILNTPVPHEHRRTGQVSIVKWTLWKAAVRSLAQTGAYFWKTRNA